jgi:hypothetical protein
MFSENDLRNLAKHIKEQATEYANKPDHDDEVLQNLIAFRRQLEAIRYSPLLFQGLLETYEVDYALMEEPLEQLPLHINDAGLLSKILVKWRLTEGK